MNNNSSQIRLHWTKVILSGTLAWGVAIGTTTYAQSKSLPTVEKVELDKYLGVWYEVARKPMSFQKQCARDVLAIYTVNENGNIAVDNRCYDREGNLQQSFGEAFVINEPYNSKFKVSFVPEAVRWIPVGRGDYWILKLDEHYQMALVGEPTRKYLWVLCRDPHPDEAMVNEYLKYAKSLGYNIKNIIQIPQTKAK